MRGGLFARVLYPLVVNHRQVFCGADEARSRLSRESPCEPVFRNNSPMGVQYFYSPSKEKKKRAATVFV